MERKREQASRAHMPFYTAFARTPGKKDVQTVNRARSRLIVNEQLLVSDGWQGRKKPV